jgi:hypothetical protein
VAHVAETFAERAHQVEAALTAVAGSVDATATQLQRTRDTVTGRASEISLVVTGFAVLICAWLIYTAILDWLLLTTTRPPSERRPLSAPGSAGWGLAAAYWTANVRFVLGSSV